VCCRRVLPGLVLKGLAAVLPAHLLTADTPGQQQSAAAQQQGTNTYTPTTSTTTSSTSSNSSSSSCVDVGVLQELRVCAVADLSAAVAGPLFESGRQDIPVDLTTAPPLYFPTERVRQLGGGRCTGSWGGVELVLGWGMWGLSGFGGGGGGVEVLTCIAGEACDYSTVASSLNYLPYHA
jgi:hypothetical protein